MTGAMLKDAISPRTACVLLFSGYVSPDDEGFPQLIAASHQASIPVSHPHPVQLAFAQPRNPAVNWKNCLRHA